MTERRHFIQRFVLPLLAVMLSSTLALATMFWLMVSQQNKLSAGREYLQLDSAVKSKVEFLTNNLRDYAIWTDSVENLVVNLDKDWANDNIGPYLFNTKGYTYTFVFDQDGNTLYASHMAHMSSDRARDVVGPVLDTVVRQLNRAPDRQEESFASPVTIAGRPAILAASAILPTIGESYDQPISRRYLAIVQPMDGAFVDAIAKGYDVEGLTIHGGAPPEVGVSLPLLGVNGRSVGHLHWTSARPGDRMLFDYLPWIVLIAVPTIAISLLMVRRAARLTDDLAASKAAAWHLANLDTLTALPNRRALREAGMRQPVDEPMAILYLDLDGFKEVNDLFGHQAGDVLLVEAAERLRGIVGASALLARVGGDEFAVLVTSVDAHGQAIELAKAIVERMAEPFESNEIRMVVSASVGLALGDPGQSIDDLARFADVAMYAAKTDGKNQWRIYEGRMDEGREIRKLLESELRDAIEAGEIDVMFQPIVDAREGVVTTVEALARWTSPSQGPVGPAIFVPIAEESGLIVKFGELVLRKACMAARDWNVNLSVNMSPAQFWNRSLVEDLLAILAECRFPPDRLELEITEGYLLSRPELAAHVIRRIRSHGIRVVLDDFGTGFASIGYLRRFELDRLKLDRSFVECIDRNREAANVARAIIGLSQALGLPITAEGVENDPQALVLTLAGCERLQGWHYGRAAPASEIAVMLRGGDRGDRDQTGRRLAG